MPKQQKGKGSDLILRYSTLFFCYAIYVISTKEEREDESFIL